MKKSFIILTIFCTCFFSLKISCMMEKSENDFVQQGQSVHMCVAGDCLLNDRILKTSYKRGHYNFDDCFASIQDYISSFDLAAINQETVLVDDSLVSTRPYGSPKAIANSLIQAGFNIVLHQNNHMFDKGMVALRKSNSYWKKQNVVNVGLDKKPVVLRKNGISFSLYNYTYGVNPVRCMTYKQYNSNLKYVNLLDRDKSELIRKLKSAKTDYQICFLHMGAEYRFSISKDENKYINSLINAGADVIVISHPHVVRTYKSVTTKKGNSAVVFYSCGNFLATQELGRYQTQLGGIATICFSKHNIENYDFVPTVCHYTKNKVETILLKDYTEDLVEQAMLFKTDQRYNLKNIYALWNKKVMGISSKRKDKSP